MSREIDPKITEFLSAIGKRGGRGRAKKYNHEKLSIWARKGGRPSVLNESKIERLRRLREDGYTLAAISQRLKVSIGTVQRAVAKLKKAKVEHGQN